MKAIMTFLNDDKISFINTIINKFCWFILFYSSALIGIFLIKSDYSLNNFDGRIISTATANLYDVSSRVNVYIYSIILFIILLAVFTFLSYVLSKILISGDETILNYTSLVSLVLCFFSIFTLTFHWALILISILHVFIIINGIINKFIFRLSAIDRQTYYGFILSITSALIFIYYKFFADTLQINGYLVYFLLLNLFYVLFLLINKNKNFLNEFIFISAPLLLIPFLSSISDEIYLILNHYQIYFFESKIIFIIGIAIILLIIFLLFLYTYFKPQNLPDGHKIIKYFYLPSLLVSILIPIWYEPITVISPDMFEQANPGLMIQQLFEYGKMPLLQNFNAHGLSDAIWGMFYVFVNGMGSEAWTSYDFFQRIIEITLVYFLFLKIIKNPYITIAGILLLPYFDLLFPPFYSFTIITLFLLWKAIQSQTVKNFLILFLFLFLLFFWRIDVGSASIATSALIFLLIPLFDKSHKIHWHNLFVALVKFFIITTILFIAFCVTLKINPFVLIIDFLNILQSAQKFGYVYAANAINGQVLWNYVAMPLAIISVIILIFAQLRLSQEKKYFVHFTFFFLSFFYIINFSHSLVRHNLAENISYPIASFSIIALGIAVFILLKNQELITRFIIFIIATSIISFQFSYPQVMPFALSENLKINIYDKFQQKMIQARAFLPSQNIDRSIMHPGFEDKEFNAFKKFIDENLSSEQTFFDLSNSPMLYFYTHKEIPHYVNHTMLMHNDYLQDRLIQQLQSYDIPIVVFSYIDPFSYNLDNMPFQLGYYKITEYIYKNYEPYKIINSREIWKRKNWDIRSSDETRNIFLDLKAKDFKNLQSYNATLLLDNDKVQVSSGMVDPYIFSLISKDNSINLSTDKYYSINIEGRSHSGGDMQIFYDINNGFSQIDSNIFHVNAGAITKSIKIPIANNSTLRDIRLDFANGDLFDLDRLQIIEDDMPVEQTLKVSTLNQNFDIKYLPYIWGEFYKSNLDSLPMQVDFNNFDSINKILSFLPLSKIQKSKNNYILINAIVKDGEAVDINVVLTYGKDNETNGSINFIALADGEEHLYAIRISSQYNWYSLENNWFSLLAGDGFDVSRIRITDGD